MTQQDKKTVQEFMQDFWKFFRKYLEPEDDDEFWDEALKEADELMQKYDNRPVFNKVVIGYIDGLDEELRKSTGRWKE